MAAAFGIHVGNTSACLALFKDGKIEVIANDSGDRVTPAVVAFSETEQVVGLSAKAGLARNSASTVIHNKKFLNESLEETEFNNLSSSSVISITRQDDVVKYEVKCGEKTCFYSSEDIATFLYSKIYDIASSAVQSETDLRAVLCVPLFFSPSSRQMVMRAAEEAGFEVQQVISEPAAAVLAYGIGLQNPDEERHCCVVYRLGGVTLDVTVVEVIAGMYMVRGSVHNPHLGGDKFTKILADYLAKEFKQKWKLDPQESRRSMAKLMSASEMCKHVLSTMSTAHCFVESLCDGVDFSYNITRARFESLIASNIQEYITPVQEALEKADIVSRIVNKVVLCGGSMKIPKLQQTLAELFSEAEVLNTINPDEVIAMGGAKQGSYLSTIFDPDCEHLAMEVPAISKPIFVKVNQSDLMCLVQASTPIPLKRCQTHEIVSSGSEVCLELHQKETVESEESKLFGKLTIPEVEAPTQVSIEMNINSAGGLHVVLTDKKSQKKAVWKLDAAQS